MNADKMFVHSLSWRCAQNRRFCRGTSMAETYALSNGFDQGLRLRAALVDIKGQLDARRWQETASASLWLVWFTDCERLLSHLV